MQSRNRMFAVDQFIGINEAADGFTEIKRGEASCMDNFLITDSFNLALRPGVRRLYQDEEAQDAPILDCFAGFASAESKEESFVIADFVDGRDRIRLYSGSPAAMTLVRTQSGALGLSSLENHKVKIFPFGGKLWIRSAVNTVSFNGSSFDLEQPYIPLVIAGASASGGGTQFERINLLSPYRRIDYSADGTSTAYVLPEEARSVVRITVDNVSSDVASLGAFDAATHTFTFHSAPVKGVGNVEFTYGTYEPDTEKTRDLILSMPLMEAYNGATDTRLFVGGVGNVCYYSGVTQSGEATPMYFPALNEIAVDMTGASVTALVRHYNKLLVFTRDGTYAISYEPVTLEGGETTAGFYLRAVNREFGNDVPGQVCTVKNYPRTITGSGIYSWRLQASSYQDERDAVLISGKVQKTFQSVRNLSGIVACDDDSSQTYYVFLNDDRGTVLVSRYGIAREDVWCIYSGDAFRNVKKAFVFGGYLCFANGSDVFCLDKDITMDAPAAPSSGPQQIRAVWESGFMDFGADNMRKFNSEIYISMLPGSNCEMTVTAATDRRSEYTEKTLTSNIFTFSNFSFENLTFNTNNTPRIQRLRLKAKKFVYYKMIFRVEKPGATATVLGFSQNVRFGTMAK